MKETQDVVLLPIAKEIMFCPEDCEHLSPKEAEQSSEKEGHYCYRYKKFVLHNGFHPRILRCDKCYDLINRFTYHPPKPGQPELYTAIRDKAKELAYLIEEVCPDSREKSLAITKIEEAAMWANASIARHTA
jgi:hypothetical protein